MPFIKTDIEGLIVFEPKVIEDARGFFMESYNANSFLNDGCIDAKFVQDNRSMSHKGVIRGLHYQIGASAQAKLVTVLKGEVIDFVVDCRKDSATYKKSYQILLTEQNKKQLFVPRGFAHGFLVLKDNTEFFYKCDNFFNKDAERGLSFFDQSIHIELPFRKEELIISEKDNILPTFEEASTEFYFS
jgi:dTDP-4-dehydrorhamnose 3,5-epimerase